MTQSLQQPEPTKGTCTIFSFLPKWLNKFLANSMFLLVTRQCTALYYSLQSLRLSIIPIIMHIHTFDHTLSHSYFSFILKYICKKMATDGERGIQKFLKLCLSASIKFNKFLINQWFSQNRSQ